MSSILHAGCAAIYLLLAGLVLVQAALGRTRSSGIGLALAGACLLTAIWGGIWASPWLLHEPRFADLVNGADLVHLLGWYGFAFALYRRTASVGDRTIWLFGSLGVLALLLVVGALLGVIVPDRLASLGSPGIDGRLILAIIGILLIENLYRNGGETGRWHVALPCVALGTLFAYDLILTADAVLFHRFSPSLVEGRAVATALAAPLLALAAARNRRWGVDIHVSRSAVFHSATLMASGVFLLGVAGAGEALRQFGADWGVIAEAGLLSGGVLVLGMLLTSGTARSRLRRLLVDHFYSHRYDYRREWVRCIATLSGSDSIALHARVIRTVAQVVDSPGGALFLRESENAAFHWAGSWNLPATSVVIAANHPLVPLLGNGTQVAEMDPGGTAWIEKFPMLWLAVPLAHAGRLTGFVLAAPPRAPFRLDDEVHDLLRVIGQEVAVFVAEQRAAQAVAETRQLHDYSQRFAFVAHDVKNVSSQLSLVLANAENHIDNPEFQRDMLATVRSSVQKIDTLLARLRASEPATAEAVLPRQRLEAMAEACARSGRPIVLEHDGGSGHVAIAPDAFDAILAHLLDNAAEASPAGMAPRVRLRHEVQRVVIDVIDRGTGMTPEFVRDQLFRPFATSKDRGTGIGAYQARALLRQAGGDLLVMTQKGFGTTMRLLLPSAAETVEQAVPFGRAETG